MGQLFDRMFRIAKSYLNEAEIKGYNINSDDEELKKIIEELNNKEKRAQRNTESESRKTSSDYTEQKKTQETYEKKMGLDMAYKILGLTPGAAPDEVKSQYKKKMREYHPDLVSSMGEEIRELAAQKTRLINEAYAFIKEAKGF